MKLLVSILCFLVCYAGLAKNNSCQQQSSAISAIQGKTSKSPFENSTVWVQGVVTGDFRGQQHLEGYFIQSINPDIDQLTSEGLFIHENNLQLPIHVGDLVALQGQVSEKFGVTQLTGAKKTKVCSSGHPLPEPISITLPMSEFNPENTEGMYVTLAEPYVITDVYRLIELGEVVVSTDLLINPTSLHRPGVSAEQLISDNQQNKLIIDDGSLIQFNSNFPSGTDGINRINAKNSIQLGQALHTSGIMHYAFGSYKLQPTAPIKLGAKLISSQSKPEPIDGKLKIAAFNIENFFTTLDNGQEICGPKKNFTCRGADNPTEYQRQLDKLVVTINTADASVMGLQELENNAKQSIDALVTALNQAAGTNKWAYIDTGTLGEDVIKVGLIYQTKHLKPQGEFALLNRTADKDFLENKNRIIVAQTFSDQQGNEFNVATVHFKSKSCRDAKGLLMNQNDGQGCYNPTRVDVAKQLTKWLNSDPTKQQAAATFIVGDFNSYQKEDPMVALKSGGFSNLADRYLSPENWTTSYRGVVGSLDYVLANEAAQQLTKGMTQWHINSVSINQLDYNTEPLEDDLPKPADFYTVDPYASSDHDVVLVGFSFNEKDQ